MDVRPAALLIFYGWPSCINGAGDSWQGIAEFNRYDYVILGAGLEDPEHPDHHAAGIIVAGTTAKVFGYIDAGVSTSHYTLRRIRRSMRQWKQISAAGVMLDDFGHDWGVSPRRQRRCVATAHLLDLDVIVNVWDPPTNLTTGVGVDFLLCESFYIKEGLYDPGWLDRADGYKGQVMSVATASATNLFRPDLYAEAWQAAKALGHVAFGWGEWNFSADSIAPWRGHG